MLAALKAGAAYVALDTALPAAQAKHMLSDCSPAVVLSAAPYSLSLLERDILPPAATAGCPTVLDVPGAIALGASHATAPLPPPATGGARLCYLMYTSGSTGLPKGVEIEHRSIVNLVAQESLLWPVGLSDRVLQAGSFSFDMSLEEIWFAFCNGAALLVADDALVRSGPAFAPSRGG